MCGIFSLVQNSNSHLHRIFNRCIDETAGTKGKFSQSRSPDVEKCLRYPAIVVVDRYLMPWISVKWRLNKTRVSADGILSVFVHQERPWIMIPHQVVYIPFFSSFSVGYFHFFSCQLCNPPPFHRIHYTSLQSTITRSPPTQTLVIYSPHADRIAWYENIAFIRRSNVGWAPKRLNAFWRTASKIIMNEKYETINFKIQTSTADPWFIHQSSRGFCFHSSSSHNS